jgi:hypothetical protein
LPVNYLTVVDKEKMLDVFPATGGGSLTTMSEMRLEVFEFGM